MYQNSKVDENVALRWAFFKNNIFSKNICKHLKLFVFIFFFLKSLKINVNIYKFHANLISFHAFHVLTKALHHND